MSNDALCTDSGAADNAAFNADAASAVCDIVRATFCASLSLISDAIDFLLSKAFGCKRTLCNDCSHDWKAQRSIREGKIEKLKTHRKTVLSDNFNKFAKFIADRK